MHPRRNHGKHRSQVWKPKGAASSLSTSSPVAATKMAGSVEKATLALGAAVAATSTADAGAAAASVSHNRMFAKAHIKSCYYPKFENTKSDEKVIRTRMIEMVSHGSANVEVTLKHSGSLFTYAGCHGGAYSKTSYGDICTAVGMHMLSCIFDEAWGSEASKMKSDFSNIIEENCISISMQLVTAVLGDNGQKPKNDYAVVTAITELGNGKPRFYSTVEILEFCQKWRLPTSNVWLFSTRESVASFFEAYDALCGEGTATSVCQALDKIADVTVPGSKNYIEAQGEILEAIIARAVRHESTKGMRHICRKIPQPPLDGAGSDLGQSLRKICASNISDAEKIKMLLETLEPSICPNHLDWLGNSGPDSQTRNADRLVINEFLKAHPTDHATKELHKLISLMKQIGFYPAAFKCYWNCHNSDSPTNDDQCYRILIDMCSKSNFRRYKQEMGRNHELWPPYRGFFVDINLSMGGKNEMAVEVNDGDVLLKNVNSTMNSNSLAAEGLADEDSNLMLKLNFLAFKLRTSLIRDGLSTLFKDGRDAYRIFYQRQMRSWGISASKQEELSKLLEEWSAYITRKYYDNEEPQPSTYLGEAEPFLEEFAKRSQSNLALIGAAGELVRPVFLSISDEAADPESADVTLKTEGFIVFFAGMPGCLNSALCKEILNSPAALAVNLPLHYLSEDLITEGEYWNKVADEQKKQPARVTLADKNAPSEGQWRQIEELCRTTKAAGIPVIPDCEGTDSNPFCLEALAVFMFRVLGSVDPSEFLEKGYDLLKFYHLYEGKVRRDFENDLCLSFGSLVKVPLLKPDRAKMPSDMQYALERGISLFRIHQTKYETNHGSVAPSEGSYADSWVLWEEQLRIVLSQNTGYLNSIQVPFDLAVGGVLEQLQSSCKCCMKAPG